ncbi:MAG: hypothetical protein LBH58_12015 [Tannerellaceae bacterium]|jgi:hypothetical protein|nr:hypothetical protein [Tannerellaceae bacterium]
MRVITEANAQIIIEVMYEEIAALEKEPKKSLRLQNKIRLMRLALMDVQKNKVNKNQIKSKS